MYNMQGIRTGGVCRGLLNKVGFQILKHTNNRIFSTISSALVFHFGDWISQYAKLWLLSFTASCQICWAAIGGIALPARLLFILFNNLTDIRFDPRNQSTEGQVISSYIECTVVALLCIQLWCQWEWAHASWRNTARTPAIEQWDIPHCGLRTLYLKLPGALPWNRAGEN